MDRSQGTLARAAPLALIVAGLLVLAAVAILAWPRPSATIEVADEPRLKVDREVIDLGDVKLGRAVEVSYTLTNVGGVPLRFSDALYVEVVEGC